MKGEGDSDNTRNMAAKVLLRVVNQMNCIDSGWQCNRNKNRPGPQTPHPPQKKKNYNEEMVCLDLS